MNNILYLMMLMLIPFGDGCSSSSPKKSKVDPAQTSTTTTITVSTDAGTGEWLEGTKINTAPASAIMVVKNGSQDGQIKVTVTFPSDVSAIKEGYLLAGPTGGLTETCAYSTESALLYLEQKDIAAEAGKSEDWTFDGFKEAKYDFLLCLLNETGNSLGVKVQNFSVQKGAIEEESSNPGIDRFIVTRYDVSDAVNANPALNSWDIYFSATLPPDTEHNFYANLSTILAESLTAVPCSSTASATVKIYSYKAEDMPAWYWTGKSVPTTDVWLQFVKNKTYSATFCLTDKAGTVYSQTWENIPHHQ